MKILISIIISAALVVSGYGQTRNVLVGTNNTVVQPTNFWSADASNARTGLGLGSAATNPASAFQPSSTVLSNLASSNAVNLTNLRATNIVGTVAISNGGTGATNNGLARTNLGLGWSALTNTNAATSLLGFTTNGQVVADTGTNVLTFMNDLRFSGGDLQFNNTQIVGNGLYIDFDDGAIGGGPMTLNTNSSIAFQGEAAAITRTNLGLGATNSVRFGSILLYQDGEATNSITYTADTLSFNQNGVTFFSLDTASGGTMLFEKPISFLGTNAITNAAITRTNLGLGATWLTNTNVTNFRAGIGLGLTALTNTNTSNFRSDIGLGWSALTNTNATNFRADIGLGATNNSFSSLSVGQLITNQASDSNASSAFGSYITIDSTVENSLAVGFGHSMSNFGNQAGGSVVLGGMGTMTNWGAFLFNGVAQGLNPASSRGNSTFTVNASNGIFLNGPLRLEGISTLGSGLLAIGSGGVISRVITNIATAQASFLGWDGFYYTAFTPEQSRTNLGLAWSALTNSNAGTGLVSVDTNGTVVGPTNFWTASPLGRVGYIQYSAPIASSTNLAEAARNLFVFSLAPSITGVTNTIQLPVTTNSALYGDIAVVVHKGPTNSATIVRNGIDLITLTQESEAISLLYGTNGWDFYPNLAFHEPIYFTTTNAALYAARSRTNLGLPLTALTNSNTTNFQAAIFATNSTPTNGANVNAINFNTAIHWMEVNVVTNGVTNNFRIPLFK